jgi:hypothetical protein
MALVNYIRHCSNYWSTTNNLAIFSGRAKVKLWGACWQSLSIKFDRQLSDKRREISKLSHMHLLLTKFHMYLEIIILQVTNTNTWRISPKGARETRETSTKSSQIGWGTPRHWPMSSPHSTMQRQWWNGLVMDRPVLGGSQPLSGMP